MSIVVATDAGIGERVIEVARAVDGVDVDALRVHLAADAGVDEEGLLALNRVSDEERTEAEPDAVPLVGRRALLPQRLGHDAEHGAAVEAEAAVPERRQDEITELHDRWLRAQGSRLRQNLRVIGRRFCLSLEP